MARKSYKKLIERTLGVEFKESQLTGGFQYLALGKDLREFEGTEYDGQFKASVFIIIQNKDSQYRMYTKSFGTGVMVNQRYEGKGYKDLYQTITENVIKTR